MNDDFFAEFDALFAGLARKAKPGGFEPNADVSLSSDGTVLSVHVEIAGAEPSELRVMVEERRLYIVGARNDRERATRGSVLMKEIEYGDFIKKLHLPVAVAYEQATASYRDGILTIRLPVSEEALLPRHRTEIRMTVQRILA
ncbi:MAG: hypothetical protein NVS2B3_12410 [Vulcanimicrobiaceae bacterium]